MKIMPCPLNGPRNIQEFVCGGPVEPHPDPNRCTDDEWSEFVWLEENRAGVVREWWCHAATSYWFIAERNTVSDEILATYPADRVFSERVSFEPLPSPPPAVPDAAKPKEAPPVPAEPVPAEATPEPEAPPVPAEAAPAETVPDAPAEESAPADDAPTEDTPADDAVPPKPEGSAA